MEKNVISLFDFQHFKLNTRLNMVIHDTENRYADAISDNDLEMVSAAGESDVLLQLEDHPDALPEDQLPIIVVPYDDEQH